jgi:hypothetical protein
MQHHGSAVLRTKHNVSLALPAHSLEIEPIHGDALVGTGTNSNHHRNKSPLAASPVRASSNRSVKMLMDPLLVPEHIRHGDFA